MADLNVQPRKRSNFLVWLLLVAAIVALIVYLMRQNDVNDTPGINPAGRDTLATDTAARSTMP